MSTEIIVRPIGPRATEEAIKKWIDGAQAVADEYQSEVELIGRLPDGSVESHIIATPADGIPPA